MKRSGQRKKMSTRREFWTIFIIAFIALIMISELVLAIVNAIVVRGRTTSFTAPLYVMPIVAVAVTFLVVWLINRNRTLTQTLIDGIDSISKGDYSVRMPETRDKEYGIIYSNFNKMVVELSAVKTMRQDFARELSHEFKTPLSSIKGFADLLAEGGLSEEEQKKFAKIIAEESGRLWRLADSTLALSKLETQNFTEERTGIALGEQLRDCIVMCESDWEKKNIEVVTEFSPVTVFSDPSLLRQVWFNLLSNAIKFTPEGGRIKVSLCGGEHACVRFTDSGCGIPEEERESIFEKYYRASNSDGTEGTGLGLSICRRICELCGGDIELENGDAGSCTFAVRLPLR